jgi:hypothetical protein
LFPVCASDPFEKRQADTNRFSKDFRVNPGNMSTNGKKAINIQKRIVHTLGILQLSENLKTFCVKLGKAYKFIKY